MSALACESIGAGLVYEVHARVAELRGRMLPPLSGGPHIRYRGLPARIGADDGSPDRLPAVLVHGRDRGPPAARLADDRPAAPLHEHNLQDEKTPRVANFRSVK